MLRRDGRANHVLRPVTVDVGFHHVSEGSVLYRAGGTVVLCTASVDAKVPAFLEGTGKGWVTAEYQMHPRANPKRQERDGRGRALGGRTQEIQRLIGRSLRGAVDLSALGPRTVTVDCDVLEADGGTRTASITGGSIALGLALAELVRRGDLSTSPLRTLVVAVSSGLLDGGTAILDLDYSEDSRARVDMNVVATHTGAIVEVQGTAEGEPVDRADFDSMLNLALTGTTSLAELVRSTLAHHGAIPQTFPATGP